MFIQLTDIPGDEIIQVDNTEIEEANRYIERVLIRKKIPLQPELYQNKHLKDLAKIYAIYRAFLKRYTSSPNETEYAVKIKYYEKLLKDTEETITKELLSQSPSQNSATFKIERG